MRLFHYLLELQTQLLFRIHSNSIAKCVLTNGLVVSSIEARTPYLKAESFRVLSSLFNITKDDNDEVQSALARSSTLLCNSLTNALGNDELTTAKRVRDVLRAAEKLVMFMSNNCCDDHNLWKEANKMTESIHSLMNSSSSNAVKSICEKLDKKIKEGLEKSAKAASTLPSVSEPAVTTRKKGKKGKKIKKKGRK